MADGIDALMYEFGAGKSAIREMCEKSAKLQEQGVTGIFDFSIGNPHVTVPAAVNDAINDSLAMPSIDLHGYTPNSGWVSTRQAIAADLNRRFATSYHEDDLILTAGASGALTSAIAALTNPGEEIVVLTPYFPEYRMYTQAWHCKCVEVPTLPGTFQPNVAAIEAAITPCTRIVIVNSPNNPTGAVYTEDVMREMASMLERESERHDKTIYLLSDEPYREITYDGHTNPWMPDIYANTIVCYSYSKSLAIPGERAGYVLVPPSVLNHDRVYDALLGSQRVVNSIMGSLMQRVIEQCASIPAPVEEYRRKRHIIYHGLKRLGYEVVRPDGAFYLWLRCLEPDEGAFCRRASDHGLMLVASDDFGTKGYARLSYCIEDETLASSIGAFKDLWDEYGGYTW